MRDNEARVDITPFNALQQGLHVALHMALTRLDGSERLTTDPIGK